MSANILTRLAKVGVLCCGALVMSASVASAHHGYGYAPQHRPQPQYQNPGYGSPRFAPQGYGGYGGFSNGGYNHNHHHHCPPRFQPQYPRGGYSNNGYRGYR